MNEYGISINESDKVAHITRNYWNPTRDYKEMDEKPFLFEVGQKVVDIFNNIVTIKEIIKHPPVKEGCCPQWNLLVEESGNCYLYREIAGIHVKTIPLEEFEKLIEIK